MKSYLFIIQLSCHIVIIAEMTMKSEDGLKVVGTGDEIDDGTVSFRLLIEGVGSIKCQQTFRKWYFVPSKYGIMCC